ncbi:MAG: phospholipid carrier-dependent glycosyltransferase [Propionibacteriales bacterium]|nr:phospholipid carrier-dependent glycosyltransferase [Propionibacteriales bacterium]
MATTTKAAPTETADKRSTSVALLGSTVDGEQLPRLRRRLTPPSLGSNRVWGWVAPIIIMLCSGILQFGGLSTPHDITFDETYYAKDAYSLLVKGYASTFINDGNDDNGSEADAKINAGTTEGIFKDGPSLVVHPELGKWMIAVGEWLFGMTAFGWRFSAALVGTLMVLVMCRLVRRLTGSTLLGCVAGALLALDTLHFVMSRIALLDIFMAFWLLCAVHCLVADRDWARLKLARRFEISPELGTWAFGPVRGFLMRPWRITAGVCFGLACGVKWSAIFVVAGFGLLTWMWDSGMRRSIGVKWAPLKSLVVDAVPAVFSIIVVGFVVYLATWVGFLTHAQRFEDAFGHAYDANDWTYSSVDDKPTTDVGHVRHDLNILWNYHKEVYMFHTGDFIKGATHPFQSDPRGWLAINRPLGIASVSGDQSVIADCPPGEQCVKQVLAIGTPVLWWGGFVMLVIGLGYWLSGRDWRFGIPIVGVLTTWLPWFPNDTRPIFFYYAIAIIPFTIIAVTLVLGKMLGQRGATYQRRLVGSLAVGTFVVAVALNFVYFHPIVSSGLLTNAEWNHRMWLTKWI